MTARGPGVSFTPMDDDKEAELDRAFREERLRKFREKFPFRPVEQDMIAEQVAKKMHEKFGIPVPRKTAEQGIEMMEARIKLLKGDKAETLEAMDDSQGHLLEKLTEGLNEINRELKDAETQLAEYKAQRGLN